jgi:hypothetical protein
MSIATHESVSTKASGAARLDVVPLTKHIGAEIRGIDLRENRTRPRCGRSTKPGSTTWC